MTANNKSKDMATVASCNDWAGTELVAGTKRDNLFKLLKALPIELKFHMLLLEVEEGMVEDCLDGAQEPLLLQALQKGPDKELYEQFLDEYDRIHGRVDFYHGGKLKTRKLKEILALRYLTIVSPCGQRNIIGQKFTCRNELRGLFYDFAAESASQHKALYDPSLTSVAVPQGDDWYLAFSQGLQSLDWIVRANKKDLRRVVTRCRKGNERIARMLEEYTNILRGVKPCEVDKDEFVYHVWTMERAKEEHTPFRYPSYIRMTAYDKDAEEERRAADEAKRVAEAARVAELAAEESEYTA